MATSSASLAPPNPLVEQLEADWRQGAAKPISSYVAQQQSDGSVVARLICTDLQWRWKSFDGRRRLEDYFSETPGVAFSDSQYFRMIRTEFLARQTGGDKPTLPEYQRRFPRYFVSCATELKKVLFTHANLVLAIEEHGKIVFETSVDRPLVFGRQFGGENPPYCRIVRQDADRVIIATSTDREVSRNAVRVDLESAGRVSVLNQSTYTPIRIDNGTVIDPGATATFARPLSVTLASISLRLR